jgi:dipeptidyl aminopeptidase/acylaminoacyl peptidase
MEGTLLKPPNYQAGWKYPLIVDAYPLMDGSNWYNPMFGNQAWASNGYAVFRPSPRAPLAWINPWKSAAWSAVAKGAPGWNVTVDDVLSGVGALVREGIVDPDRMCLYGFSNGGGVVNYLVTRTPLFKCAVSVAGALSDWVRPSLLNSGSASWLSDWAGATLWGDPRSYIELSAVFGLKNVHTPMLLADGDKDGDFLLDTIEMYNGLREANIDVTLLRYADQGHGFTGAALRDFWSREMLFFAGHLGNPPDRGKRSND